MLDVMNNADLATAHGLAFFCAIFVAIFAAIIIAIAVFYCLGMYRLFEKLGLKGWYIFIPFYNVWKLFEKIGLEWYWFLIYICPLMFCIGDDSALSYTMIATLIGSLACIYNIAKKFNKSKSWIIIAFFFSEIALPLLGLSADEKCDDTVEVTPNAMFDDKKKSSISSKVKQVTKKVEKTVASRKKTKEDK